MRIVYISTEISPVAKVGGLADVTLGLSRAMQSLKNNVCVLLPKYSSLKVNYLKNYKPLAKSFKLTFQKKEFTIEVFSASLHGLTLFFLDAKEPHSFFSSAQIYGDRADPLKFAFFSSASLEFLYRSMPEVDLIHISDWQTAILSLIFKENYHTKMRSKVLLTIHNMHYQGICGPSLLKKLGGNYQKFLSKIKDPKKNSKINLLKAGILYSDYVTTVSPRYFKEIQTPPLGHGLEQTIIDHKHKMCGILNGIDTEIWNPGKDPSLSNNYTVKLFKYKAACKDSLRKLLNMPLTNNTPLVISVCRLVPQKGILMIKKALEFALKNDAQFILYGSSPIAKIQEDFTKLKKNLVSNPNIKFIFDSYNEELSHQIYAGADMIICPSLFEPCGLTQLIGLQYGTVPIVRKTGGLADTVFDYHDSDQPNGFTYTSTKSEGIYSALKRAFYVYKNDPKAWQELIFTGMNMDYSWEKSAKKYFSIYKKLVESPSSFKATT